MKVFLLDKFLLKINRIIGKNRKLFGRNQKTVIYNIIFN